jgi:Domain of unknown function (DUF6265)
MHSFEDSAIVFCPGEKAVTQSMKLRNITLLALSLSLLGRSLPGGTRGQQAAGLRGDPPTNSAAKPTLGDFAWLVGRWQGSWGPRTTQQAWLPPKADAMVGTFQVSENGRTLVIELYSLVQTLDGVELHLRHFTPSLVPWEKSGDTVLRLSSIDPRTMVFENTTDRQPQRQTLTRVDLDTYISRAEIGSETGDAQAVAITFHRQRDLVSSHRR